jgi:hypothetical protein
MEIYSPYIDRLFTALFWHKNSENKFWAFVVFPFVLLFGEDCDFVWMDGRKERRRRIRYGLMDGLGGDIAQELAPLLAVNLASVGLVHCREHK